MSVYTTLEDRENNIEIDIDDLGNCSISNVIKSIEFRIKKHREFIKRDRKVIKDNIEYLNIISDATKRIEHRTVKIAELTELLNCVFDKK
jgi:predicted ribosome quality control (RQC) complex YloA/Tae2 family protein